MTSGVPFEFGRGYMRDELLHFVGSKQGQTGIIWGPRERGVVICTSGGKRGKNAGYEDRMRKDGTWEYFGQGESGDQDPDSFANRLLAEAERSVLLFKTREPSAASRKSGDYRKSYSFAGEFCVGGWDSFVPSSGPRKGDTLIKFILVPAAGAEAAGTGEQVAPIAKGANLKEVRAALLQGGNPPARGSMRLVEYRARSARLRDYARCRAGGRCELCGQPAPFLTESGEPFLEVHHIFRLADDGPDAPENVMGLCPNCHRRAHHGAGRKQLAEVLHGIACERESAVVAGTIG